MVEVPSEDQLDDAAYSLGLVLDRLLVGVGLVDPRLMLRAGRLDALRDIGHPYQLSLGLEPSGHPEVFPSP